MNRILLAEDDKRLAQLVKSYLEENDFTVLVEEHGDSVIAQIDNWEPDLVILDIMLPGRDGLSICQEIRPRFNHPILMLTARNTNMDQVVGLEFGADDYVVKPVEPRVLLARIRALLRRYAPVENQSQRLNFGTLSISADARKVTLEGREVNLSSHEFELLFTLARQAGKVLNRDYLFQIICGRPYDGLDRSIDVRISQLRKKLEDSADSPYRIKTVWGRGYLFVADAW